MSLISIQRSPSPNEIEKCFFSDHDTTTENDDLNTISSFGQKSRSSVCYFIVRGAAVFLSHQDQANTSSSSINCAASTSQIGGEIQSHLQAMLHFIRSEDKLSMAVRLQSLSETHIRYLAVLSTFDPSETKETALMGFDILDEEKTTIGVTVPLTGSTRIELDGDGGITIYDPSSSVYMFRPISIKAMWSLFQFLHKELHLYIKSSPFFAANLSHQWLKCYAQFITSDDVLCSHWHYSPPIDDGLRPTTSSESLLSRTSQQFEVESQIRAILRQIMQSVDLDNVTTQDIRKKLKLEPQMSNVVMNDYKEFIDKEMLIILGQLDKPSKITDYLYLGTEWNASNWDELLKNKIGYILNVTKEVDNFFPTHFNYLKIWVNDEATTELLVHWQKTYDFIKKAKEDGRRVLVHCKKGISRSASTVIAYCMKEYGWTLDRGLNYVKERRNCITPNEGFMEQLATFGGVLTASKNRHSAVFNVPRDSDSISIASFSSRTSTDEKLCKRNSFQKSTTIPEKPSAMLENDVPTEAAANKPSPKPNVKQPAKARSFFQQSPAKPSRKTSSPIIKSSHSGAQAAAGQQRKISLQPNDDPGKVGGGRVKQARDNIERAFKHKSVKTSKPTTSSFVSSIAKKLGYLSLSYKTTNNERKEWINDIANPHKNRKVYRNPNLGSTTKRLHVQSLVDVFENSSNASSRYNPSN